MIQRGRKSIAALVAVDGEAVSPIRAPSTLTQAERDVWLVTVNSKPADWFGPEHGPMLVDYVRHVCRGHVIDTQLDVFEPEWLATEEGLRRYAILVGIGKLTAGMVLRLATAMRLTQQSIYRADKAGMGPGKGRKPWQRASSPDR